MASVRMTKDLKSGIISKFREALVSSIQKNPKITNLGEKLYKLVHSPQELEWLELTSKLMESFNGYNQKRSNQFSNSISTSNRLVFILAPEENTIKDTPRYNFQLVSDWNSKNYPLTDPEDSKKGEFAVEIPLGIERPLIVSQSFNFYAYDNETSCRNAYLITEKETINLIMGFLDGEVKALASVNKLDDFLLRCTTLKKFLDEWPGAENLIPQSYLEKMFEHKIKSSIDQRAVIAKNTLEEDFKDEMNAAILTAKLIT